MERNPYELLSKADVLREYRYPRWLLEHDIKAGKIAYHRSGPAWGSRFYIPRYAVEDRIREITTQESNR